jgi:hypothetical protein
MKILAAAEFEATSCRVEVLAGGGAALIRCRGKGGIELNLAMRRQTLQRLCDGASAELRRVPKQGRTLRGA